jgi:hypothetical protein
VKRIAAVVLGLALSCAPLLAAPPVKERIVGTWRLVSIENRDSADQPWEKRFGEQPKGLIIYDSAGHMAVQFEKMPAPSKFASGDDWKPTPDEARTAYLGYVAYFGTYTVDEAASTVTHHVEGSLRPSYLGTDQVRPATFEGKRLILSDGKKFRVVWERAE